MDNSNTNIRPAKLGDIPGIIIVLEQNTITNKSQDKKTLEAEGFLLHTFTTADLTKMISEPQNHIVLVAMEDDEVIGYTMGYDLSINQPEGIENVPHLPETPTDFLTTKNIFHRHVAVKLNKRGKGAQLSRAFFQEAAARKYKYAIANIVQAPFKNLVSIRVHERLGYKEIGTVISHDITYGIYIKEL